MTDFKNLINNMPILYMQEELITDEKGTPRRTDLPQCK